MPDESTTPVHTKAWLVLRSGSLAGTRYQVPESVLRVGRAPENDIVVQGPLSATVSLNHMEIRSEAGLFRVRDLGSTNGTYLNGERITEAEVQPHAIIRLGGEGPEFSLVAEEPAAAGLDSTLVIPAGIQLAAAAPSHATHEVLLSEAVEQARRARIEGTGGQTLTIMRAALTHAIHHRTRRFRHIIICLAAALLGVSAFAFWKITALKTEKAAIDAHIQQIEAQLAANQTPQEADRLVTELSEYQSQARSLEHEVFYRYGVRTRESYLTREIRSIMAEFGADDYSVPPEFEEQVEKYIKKYQGPDRPLIEHALGEAKGKLTELQRLLDKQNLPPDLGYMPLVESALQARGPSAAGAAGPWQLTAQTARALGLRVDATIDERNDFVKSTQAASRYLRQLILDFGSGSSVMLALAAYDSGPTKVKQAVMKVVQDPIKQRNFWYLYRVRALPDETREYVPKVFAAIIIGRDPEHFGF